VQRVEVLKGPQGTLFGQNSTGGAINYIAAKPTKTLQAGADASFGRFDSFTGSAFLSGPITDTLRGRIAIRRRSSGPWQQSATRPGDRTGGTDRTQGRILLDWDANDKLTFELNANGWIDRSTPQAGQYVGLISTRAPANVAGAATTAGNAQSADWDPNTHFYTHDNFYQIALRTNYDFTDDLKLTSITAYQKLHRDTLVDADGLALNNFTAGNKGYIKSFSQELRLAGNMVITSTGWWAATTRTMRPTIRSRRRPPVPASPSRQQPRWGIIRSILMPPSPMSTGRCCPRSR
jgi:outer membrane receptor protein involved in Fe transport